MRLERFSLAMTRLTHLNALQALEMALREGSLQGAAEKLGITPAALGQRIRSLERFLETDLLLRGRSGLQPTPALRSAMDDLKSAFEALERVAATLDLQRTSELHIVADPDWSDLWLLPRLAAFRDEHPNVLFNINGEGDVPMRLGAADIVIERRSLDNVPGGEPLYTERFLPVAAPENAARITDPEHTFKNKESANYLPVGALENAGQFWRHSEEGSVEGFPLLHVQSHPDQPQNPGWPEWIASFGYQRTAPERGVRYSHVRDALEGARVNAGLLICGLSCVLDALDDGSLELPFPPAQSLAAQDPYVLRIRSEARVRPQVGRFCDWLRSEAGLTRIRMEALTA